MSLGMSVSATPTDSLSIMGEGVIGEEEKEETDVVEGENANCIPSEPESLPKLHRAVLSGETKTIRELLRARTDTEMVDKTTARTALHFAAIKSNLEATTALVGAGANKEARDSEGRTPLHLACQVAIRSDPTVARQLTTSGASAVTIDAHGTTPLHIAVSSGLVGVVRAMVSSEGDAQPPTAGTSRGLGMILHEAVRAGHAGVVGALVDGGWEIGSCIHRKYVSGVACPAISAASGKSLHDLSPDFDRASSATAETRFIRGNVRSRDDVAQSGSHARTVRPLEENDDAGSGGASQFEGNVIDAVGEKLSDKGQKQQEEYIERWQTACSPLMLAADSGRPDVVKALLRGKSKGFPDDTGGRGFTALHIAMMRGSECIAQALLDEGGANRDAVNHDGDTPLHVAIASRRTNVGEVLLRAGASVNLPNRRGHTPLHFAAAMGLAAFAKELLDHGANVDATDGERAPASSRNDSTAKTAHAIKAKISYSDRSVSVAVVENGGGEKDAYEARSCVDVHTVKKPKKRGIENLESCRELNSEGRKRQAVSAGDGRKKSGSPSETPSRGRRTVSATAVVEVSTALRRRPEKQKRRKKRRKRCGGTVHEVVIIEGPRQRDEARIAGDRGEDGDRLINTSNSAPVRGTTRTMRVLEQAPGTNGQLEAGNTPLDGGRADRLSHRVGAALTTADSVGVFDDEESSKFKGRRVKLGAEVKNDSPREALNQGGVKDAQAPQESLDRSRKKVDARGPETTTGQSLEVDGGHRDGEKEGFCGDRGDERSSDVVVASVEPPSNCERLLGKTPLHYAAKNGRLEAARVLLKAGANALHSGNARQETPLFVAAWGGHVEVVGLLLEQLGLEDVDACVSTGSTPLSVAVENGHVRVAEMLINKGASIHRRDPVTNESLLGKAVVAYASPQSCLSVVRLLLHSGADADGIDKGHRPYIRRNEVASAKKPGAKQRHPRSEKSTSFIPENVVDESEEHRGSFEYYPPLHNACIVEGGLGIIEALLEAGANTDATVGTRYVEAGSDRDRVGVGAGSLRPLHVAAAYGNAPAIRALTLKGCKLDPETSDPSRSTPLALAVRGEHLEATKALLEAGANIEYPPRCEDGSQLAPSLARLAAMMKRGDIVSAITWALVNRDSAKAWTRDWAGRRGFGWASGSKTSKTKKCVEGKEKEERIKKSCS